ncbi:MAG: NusG domain II-containing protein [Sphaerochaetaceae bacterium]|nr:NusG domain II-containing protein [Sphaerochaetaceae bacterium]
MKKVTPVDIIIFIIFLSICIISFTLYTNVSGKPEVHVTIDDKEWVYDLSEDTTASFTGPIGDTTIEISNNRVHVHSSDCKNQICVTSGWIDEPGEWISCLPNDVFILIKGQQQIAQKEETDDISF